MSDCKITADKLVRDARALGNATKRLGESVREALRAGSAGKAVLADAANILYNESGRDSQYKPYKALRTMMLDIQADMGIPDESAVTLKSPKKAGTDPVKIEPKGKSRGGNARGSAKAAEKPAELKAELEKLVEKFGLESVLEVLASLDQNKPADLKAVA